MLALPSPCALAMHSNTPAAAAFLPRSTCTPHPALSPPPSPGAQEPGLQREERCVQLRGHTLGACLPARVCVPHCFPARMELCCSGTQLARAGAAAAAARAAAARRRMLLSRPLADCGRGPRPPCHNHSLQELMTGKEPWSEKTPIQVGGAASPAGARMRCQSCSEAPSAACPPLATSATSLPLTGLPTCLPAVHRTGLTVSGLVPCRRRLPPFSTHPPAPSRPPRRWWAAWAGPTSGCTSPRPCAQSTAPSSPAALASRAGGPPSGGRAGAPRPLRPPAGGLCCVRASRPARTGGAALAPRHALRLLMCSAGSRCHFVPAQPRPGPLADVRRVLTLLLPAPWRCCSEVITEIKKWLQAMGPPKPPQQPQQAQALAAAPPSLRHQQGEGI